MSLLAMGTLLRLVASSTIATTATVVIASLVDLLGESFERFGGRGEC